MQQTQLQSSDKSTLLEYSEVTEYEMIQNSPGGIEATLAAHRAGWLPHNAPLVDVTYKSAASLNEIFPKKSQWRHDNCFQVLFIFGKMGTAVVLITRGAWSIDFQIRNVIVLAQQKNGSFRQFVYPTSGETVSSEAVARETFKSNTAAFKKIRSHIGSLSSRILATTGMTTDALVRAKINKKLDANDAKLQVVSPAYVISSIATRFRPLWEKEIIRALASIQEDIRQAAKNHNYKSAREFTTRAERLYSFLNNPTEKFTTNDIINNTGPVVRAIKWALLHTALHYYPEEFRGAEPTLSNLAIYSGNTGMTRLLQQLSAGDREKIGMLLFYFKRGILIS